MSKIPVIGWIHEPLSAALGTRAKVAVLRILWRASTPIAYREVVRRSGMAYGSIDLALGELTATGLVLEMAGGRERRVRLGTGHRLGAAISNLFQVESDFFVALRIELRTLAQACGVDGLIAAAMIGAVARREELLGEEIEIILLVREASGVARCAERVDLAAESISTKFGVRLKLTAYDIATARTVWRQRTAATERDLRDAELLVGEPLAAMLDQGLGQTTP